MAERLSAPMREGPDALVADCRRGQPRSPLNRSTTNTSPSRRARRQTGESRPVVADAATGSRRSSRPGVADQAVSQTKVCDTGADPARPPGAGGVDVLVWSASRTPRSGGRPARRRGRWRPRRFRSGGGRRDVDARRRDRGARAARRARRRRPSGGPRDPSATASAAAGVPGGENPRRAEARDARRPPSVRLRSRSGLDGVIDCWADAPSATSPSGKCGQQVRWWLGLVRLPDRRRSGPSAAPAPDA